MAKTIVGLYESQDKADTVAEALRQASCDPANVEVSRQGAERVTEKEEKPGFFARLFGQEDREDREMYSEGLRRGNVAVAVHAEDRDADAISSIMKRYDPIDIEKEAEAWRQGGGRPLEAGRRGEAETRPSGEKIPVVEENLEVAKRRVDRGGVRVYSRVVEEPVVSKTARVTEEVSLSSEEQERTEEVGGTERQTEIEVERTRGKGRGEQPRTHR